MKSVRRVSVIRRDPEGGVSQVVIFKKPGRKRKKQTKGLKSIERAMHRVAKAENTFASDYLARHEKSNRKRRDGWLVDLDKNLFRASKKAGKKLKLTKLAGL